MLNKELQRIYKVSKSAEYGTAKGFSTTYLYVWGMRLCCDEYSAHYKKYNFTSSDDAEVEILCVLYKIKYYFDV